MAAERLILCGSCAAGTADRGAADAVRLIAHGDGRNVFLTIQDMYQGIYKDIPPAFLDLLDIAVYVYAADQAVPRTGGRETAPNWRRNLAFKIPVQELDLWKSPEVCAALVETLSFLSEDKYHFEFVPLLGRPSLRDVVLNFNSTAFDRVVDEVMMFSGGLDSLGGAVREAVVDQRKVLLVNHRSTPKMSRRHEQLVEELRRSAGSAAPLHLPVRINKTSELSRESTQRTRSFLYAALGATFTRMIGLSRFRFYENGIMSLNLPIAPQVVGARATRTTRPLVLAGFTRLFGALAGQPLAVENPFLNRTKTDVVSLIMDAGCASLIGLTKSCVETRARSAEQPHCGVCSQCIDRRFAVLAARQATHDPAEGYAVDLVIGERPDPEDRTLLLSYVETAHQVEGLSELQFLSRYGELGRVLSYLPGGRAAALKQTHELYTRHARQVNEVVDRALAEAAATGEFRRRGLPDTCLVRLVANTALPSPSCSDTPCVPENIFRKDGQVWVTRYRGGPQKLLLPQKGAVYLHALISRPNITISAAQLASDAALQDRSAVAQLGDDGGSRADKEALHAYRTRADELRGEIEQAKKHGDFAAQQQAEADLEQFLKQLRQNAKFLGRTKRVASDVERVRKAVTNAITRAIAAIGGYDKPLAQHLTQAINRGLHCAYRPEQGLTWDTVSS